MFHVHNVVAKIAELITAFGALVCGKDPAGRAQPISVDEEGNINPAVPSILKAGNVICEDADTPYPLSEVSDPIIAVHVQSSKENADREIVRVGNDSVRSHELSPGESVLIQIDDLNKVWVESSNGGDVVNYLAWANKPSPVPPPPPWPFFEDFEDWPVLPPPPPLWPFFEDFEDWPVLP